jgi:uncharacterized membrane protein YfcA
MAGLAAPELIICVVVVLLAGFVRGYTGFGFSALVVAALVLVLPPAQVVPMVFLLEIAASAWLLPRIRASVNWSMAGWLLAGAAIGNPLGVYMLAVVSPAAMKLVISGFILLMSLLLLLGCALKSAPRPAGLAATGLLSGLVNGASAAGGLPVVLFLLAGATAAATLRATVIAYFFLTDFYAMAWSGAHGLLDGDILLRTALLLAPLVIGVQTGSRTFHFAEPESFKRLTLGLLIVLALTGLAQALWGI